MGRNNKIFSSIKNIFLATIAIFLMTTIAVEAQMDAEQKFKGFNLQGYTEEGEKSWDVNGETADIVGAEVKLSNVNANAYGEQEMSVTAQTGTIDQKSGELLLKDDVIITSGQGTQVLTDSLNWSREKDLVSTDDDILITNEGLTVTGKGMDATPGLKSAQIRENVAVTVDPEPKSKTSTKISITSDGPMIVDQKKMMAEFNDNVRAVQDDQTLQADKMEVYFDEKMTEITGIVCTGNVEIVRGENMTFAEKAVYDGKTKRLTFSGRPKLILTTEGNDGLASFGN